jgi:hypothetical protein
MKMRRLAGLAVVALALTGCSTLRSMVGITTSEPSVEIKSAESRWLLIQNPRFGDVPSEPEYVWVEEDKVPLTLKTLFRGKGSIIASPEIVSQYGSPPGGGKISPRQGVPYTVASPARPGEAPGTNAKSTAPTVRGATAPQPAASPAATEVTPTTPRGMVIYVDTTRIVIDLTTVDGIRAGSLVSLRRDRIPIVHPVTGEVLGELDEELGTARVTETRDRFSVAEIQTVVPGATIQVKDRAVPK